MLTPLRPPPKDYYQNNCLTLFGYVQSRYADILTPVDQQQLEAYLGATDAAQRLFARLLTRKGPIFRLDKLCYDEVVDTAQAVAELQTAGLVAVNPRVSAEQLLQQLTKAELLALPQATAAMGRQRKPQIIAMLLDRRSDLMLTRLIGGQMPYLVVQQPRVWQHCLYLYFGESHQDWSAFVLRDLGQVQYEDVQLQTRPYESRDDFEASVACRTLAGLSHRLDEHGQLALELSQCLARMPVDRWQLRRRNRALLRVAQFFERQGAIPQALATYTQIEAHPARERCVRAATRAGMSDYAQALLADIKAAPLSEAEWQFAERFGKRNAGFQPRRKTVEIQQTPTDMSIESWALADLQARGEITFGIHSENHLVRSLTGLIYWPAVFAPVRGAFTHPFQSAPHDLLEDDFVAERQQLIADLERHCQDDDALFAHMQAIYAAKHGVANPLVSWRLFEHVDLPRILGSMPAQHIRRLCAFLIRNLHQYRSGFPDLFVVTPGGGYEFVEVKGPGDQLQPGQRLWLRVLHQLDMPASVLRIKKISTAGG